MPALAALTKDQALQAQQMRKDGMSYIRIGQHFGVSERAAKHACLEMGAYHGLTPKPHATPRPYTWGYLWSDEASAW